jgi:mono/diheme cytochrome c family protein
MRSSFAILTLCCGVLLGACVDDLEREEEDNEEEEDVPECNAVQTARVNTIADLTANETAGAEVFAQTCAAAACHGADGSSGPAPDLSDEVPEFDRDGLTCLLLTGVDEMPSQASLSDQQLADVIAYVQANF